MLPLGQLLVQTPEHLYNGQCGGCDGVGEIATRGGHGPHHSHRALTRGRTQALHTTCTFVEGSQAGAQVGGVAAVGGHLPQTTRNLTKGLGPARGGVSHHRHVHALVPEVLCEGDPGVNGGLTGGHGHVGGVGHQRGAVHDTHLLAIHGRRQLGEITQHLSHLVSALPTPDVHDAVRVGELGKRLGNDGLSTTEGAGHRTCSSQHRWENGINDAQTSGQSCVTRQLLHCWPRATYRPEVEKLELVLLVLGLVVHLQHHIVRVVLVLAVRAVAVHLCYGTIHIWRTHDLVRMNNLVLKHCSKDVSSCDGLSFPEIAGGELPFRRPGQGGDVDPAGHEHVLAHLEDVLQGALDPVEDGAHDARAQLHTQGGARPQHRVTHRQARCIFVHLDTGCVTL
mmetsp:Transcript_3936/g.5851  ORF Transcript_3936/g.5851 Transcript_3936/m.5851 type:complete len:395 (-) Transcript_3936:237-1421(-)